MGKGKVGGCAGGLLFYNEIRSCPNKHGKQQKNDRFVFYKVPLVTVWKIKGIK